MNRVLSAIAKANEVVDLKDNLPSQGVENKVYVVKSDATMGNKPTTYIFKNGVYEILSGGGGSGDSAKLKKEIEDLDYSVYNLAVDRYYDKKITPKQGLQFDGFSDDTKLDMARSEVTANVAVGATTVNVKNSSGFKVGDNLFLYDKNGSEIVVVTSIISSTQVGVTATKNSYSTADAPSLTRTSGIVDTLSRFSKQGEAVSEKDISSIFPYAFTSNGGGIESPKVKVDKNNNIHLLFRDTDHPNFMGSQNVHYKKYNSSMNLVLDIWLTASTNYVQDVDIDVDGDGNAYCTYLANAYYNAYCTKISSTGTVGAEIQITNFTRYNYVIRCAVDSNKVLHVMQHGYGYDANILNVSHHSVSATDVVSAVTWFTTDTTSGAHNYISDASVNLVDNSLHVLMYSYSYSKLNNNTSYYNIRYVNRASSGSWGSYWVTAQTAYHYSMPSLFIDGNGVRHVVFQSTAQNTSSYYNIGYMTISSTSSFSAITWLTTSTSEHHYDPVIVRDTNGNRYIYYRRYSSNTGNLPWLSYIIYNASNQLTFGNLEGDTNRIQAVQPRASIDSLNNRYVFYLDRHYGVWSGSLRKNETSKWFIEQKINRNVENVDIVIDANNKKYMIFESHGYSYKSNNLGYVTLDANGVMSNVTWLTTNTANTYNYSRPKASIDSNGTIHVVFESQNSPSGTNYNVGYLTISSSGTVSAVQWITTWVNEHTMYPNIFIKDNVKHIVFHSTAQNVNEVKNYGNYTIGYLSINSSGTVSGVTWVTKDINTTNGYTYQNPVVGVCSNNIVHVLFYGYGIDVHGSNYYHVGYSKVGSGGSISWVTDTTLTQHNYPSDIVVDGSKVYGLFYGSSANPTSNFNHIGIVRLDGGVVGTKYPVTSDSSHNYWARGFVRNGTLHITYYDNSQRVLYASVDQNNTVLSSGFVISDNTNYRYHQLGDIVVDSNGKIFVAYKSKEIGSSVYGVALRIFDKIGNSGVVVDSTTIPVKDSIFFSKRESYPGNLSSAKLWLNRNRTVSKNVTANTTAGSTTIPINNLTYLKDGDVVDIIEGAKRERLTITLLGSSKATPDSTIDVSTALVNSYTTSAIIERIDIIPQISIVGTGANESFVNMVYERTITHADGTYEDVYGYTTSTAGTDIQLKFHMKTNDATLAPRFYKYGLALGV